MQHLVITVNLGIVATLGAHALMAFTRLTPFVSMVSVYDHVNGDNDLVTILQILMGFSYSILACALWPMVSYIVPEHHLGTAYGMSGISELTLIVLPISRYLQHAVYSKSRIGCCLNVGWHDTGCSGLHCTGSFLPYIAVWRLDYRCYPVHVGCC